MIRHTYAGTGFANTDLSAYDNNFLQQLYFDMLRIRRIEEAIEARYHEDEMKTPIHLVIGQEASSVGACAALKKSDRIYATHRTHGNYLAKGGDLKAMLSELYCRANGCVGSRGGSMHLIDPKVGMAGTSAIVGAIVPIATGDGLAVKLKNAKDIIGVFLGDAATEEGVVWESFNFSALKKLPVIYFCENNFYSVCSPLENRQPDNIEIYKKAASFGLKAEQVDATNVIEVYEATKRAVKHIHEKKTPYFLELMAYRMRGHGGAGDDSHTGYRKVSEVSHWQTICPLGSFEKTMLTHELLDNKIILAMEKRINSEIEAAFTHAQNSPNPKPEDLYLHQYSE